MQMTSHSAPLARTVCPVLAVVIAAATLYLASCDAPAPAVDEPGGTAPTHPPAAQPVDSGRDGPAAQGSTSPEDSAAAGSGAGGPPSPGAQPPLTAAGWGPIEIGMTRAEVVAAAGEDANPGAVGGPDPEQCDEFRPESAPRGLLVMIEQGRLTRITLSAGTGITTERGFGVGDDAQPITEAYGDSAVVSLHKYSPAPAAYITVWKTAPGGPDARGLVYEIGSDGRVSHIHAGGPSIQYVEGCL